MLWMCALMQTEMSDSTTLLSKHGSPAPNYGLNSDVSAPRGKSTLSSCLWGVPFVAYCSLSAAAIMLVAGVGLGFTPPTLTELGAIDNPNQHIADQSVESSLFAAFGVACAPIGALVAWPVSDYLGHQSALMIGGVPSLIGWLMLAYAHFIVDCRRCFFAVLYTGRMLIGFSIGWSVFCVSVYISEVSSAKWKGRFGNCNQLLITIGVMLAYALGIRSSSGFQISYSTISLMATAMILVFEVLMCFAVESPRWLYKNKKNCTKVLRKLRGDVDLSEELQELSKASSQQYTVWEQLMEFKKFSVVWPFVIGIFLMLFQQFVGIGVIVAYCTPIFKQAHYNDFQASLITTFANGGIQVVVTLFSALVIDHFGRKFLLATSSIGLMISTTMLGAYFFVYDHNCSGYLGPPEHAANATLYCITNSTDVHCHFPCNTEHFGFVAITGVLVFMASFGIGWGPIVWTLMSELLPDQVRALGGSIITFINWSCATIVIFSFHFYVRVMTIQGTWWSFTVVQMASLVFVVLFLPETKGHSLKAIQDNFKKHKIINVSFK